MVELEYSMVESYKAISGLVENITLEQRVSCYVIKHSKKTMRMALLISVGKVQINGIRY